MFTEQAAETWLGQFKSKISTQWDFTAIHINKNSLAGAIKDVVRAYIHLSTSSNATYDHTQDHYWNTYQKPIWVTEFACVDGLFLFLSSRNYENQAWLIIL